MVSCKQNDIALYNGAPRLEFTSSTSCVFDDTDYVNKTTEKEFETEVRLIGAPLSSSKTFVMTCVENPLYAGLTLPKTTFEQPYTFPTNSSVIKVKFKVTRPESVFTTQLARLAFNHEEGSHQFEAGRKEHITSDLDVRTNINQHGLRWSWNQELWGLYSTRKYLFMMDTLGKTFDQIAQTKEEVNKVGNLYQAYRKNNPPLMDDEKDPSEIFFPKH